MSIIYTVSSLSPKDATSHLYRCFQAKCWHELHYLVLPVQTFTARTCHTNSTEFNQPHFLRILNVMRKFHSDRFFQELWLWGTPCCLDASLNNISLTSSSFFNVYSSAIFIMFTSYYIFFHHNSFNGNSLHWVTHKPCIEWTLV